MPWQRTGIWCPMCLCFQGGGGAAARAGGGPRLAFGVRLVQLFRQPLVADLARFAIEEGQEIGADGAPSFQGEPRHPRQLGIIVGQPAAGVPHRHQDEHVGADLLGGELKRVADEIGDVELHEGPFAHAASRAARTVRPMEPAVGPYVMTPPRQGEVCR